MDRPDQLSPTVTDAGIWQGNTGQSSVPSQSLHTPFSLWLDTFRWIAALSVVFDHTSNRFLVRITDVPGPHRTLPFYLFTFAAGFGHQAVMIFFVLSGYLVGGGLWKEAKRNKSVQAGTYLLKRVSRLCIVLYPAFLAIALMNAVGIFVFHGLANGVYSSDVLVRMRPPTLACNAFFFQTGLCDTYGADGALWSLYNEFWYYVLWLLVMMAVVTSVAWRRAALLLTTAATLILFTVYMPGAASIGPYMLIWVLGVGVAWIPRPLLRSNLVSGAMLVAGMLAMRLLVRRVYQETHPFQMFFIDLVISCLFANLLITMKHSNRLRPPFFAKWNTALAAFSFSLYCIHIPVLNLYGAALKRYTGTGWQMVPDSLMKWLIVASAIGISVLVAYLFSLLTEVHTGQFRSFLARYLLRAPLQSSPARLPAARRQTTQRPGEATLPIVEQ